MSMYFVTLGQVVLLHCYVVEMFNECRYDIDFVYTCVWVNLNVSSIFWLMISSNFLNKLRG